MYIRKTKDEWELQGDYGYGWEYLSSYDDHQEARTDLRAYRENEPDYLHRIMKRRVKLQEGM